MLSRGREVTTVAVKLVGYIGGHYALDTYLHYLTPYSQPSTSFAVQKGFTQSCLITLSHAPIPHPLR